MKYIKYCLALLLALTVTATLFHPATTMAKYVDKAQLENVDFTLYTNQKTYEIENIAADGDLTELADGYPNGDDPVEGYLMRYGYLSGNAREYSSTELKEFGFSRGDSRAENGSTDDQNDFYITTVKGKGIYVVDAAGTGFRNIEWYALCDIKSDHQYYVRFGMGAQDGITEYELYYANEGDEYYSDGNGYYVDKEGNRYNYNMELHAPNAYQIIGEEYVDAYGYTCVKAMLYTGMRLFINGDRAATEQVVAEDIRNGETGVYSCILRSRTEGGGEAEGIGFSSDYQHASTGNSVGLRYIISHMMIVDLTETFGRGNEPPLWWCDQYIPWVDENTTETQTVQWFPEASYSAWDYEFHGSVDGFGGDMGYYEEEDRVNVGAVDADGSGMIGTELYDVNPAIVNPDVPSPNVANPFD